MSYRDRRRADEITTAIAGSTAAASEHAVRQAAYLVVSTPTKAARRAGDIRTQEDPSPDQTEELVALEAALTHEARCSECGRALTDPISQARGIGPDCARGTS